MRSHTQAFKNEIKQYGRQLSSIMYTGSILIQHLDNTYNNSLYRDEINSIQYYYDCELFKTCMQTLVIDSKVEIPIGTAIDCRLGVKVNNANENLIFGVYYVNKVEQQKDKKSWLVTCYDKMIETMKDYESFYNATTDTTFTTDKNYYYYDNDKQRYKRYTGERTGNPTTLGLYQSAFPMTIRDYILAICNRLNISTMNISQETLGNFLKQVTSEHYIDVDGNKMGYTYRDVLDEIAKALGKFIYISSNSLTTKSCISTDDTINEDYFNDKNVNIGKKIGPYNVVVLSRANDSDNIHYPAILPSNPIEYKITNNLILEQDNRQDFIQTIYNRITGLEFYTNDFLTKGIMYYELGDKYNVSIDGVTYPCLMLSDDIKITTGLKESIRTNEPQQSVTDYKYSSSTDKTEIASRNAKILVDKANASIEQIVEAVGEDGEVTTASIVQSINDSGSQIQLNANKIYINGVTFDNQQKMTMTDGNIDIIDNGTDLIENSHITIQSINLDKLSWLTSSVIKFQEQLSGGSQDTRLSSSGFNYSYQNTNNTERSSSSLGGDILSLSYYNQSDNQDCSLQLMSNAINMAYFTENGGVTTTHNVFNVDSNGVTTISNSTANQKSTIVCERTDTNKQIEFGVGAGGVNRGIFDEGQQKWLFYTDDTNTYINSSGTTYIDGKSINQLFSNARYPNVNLNDYRNTGLYYFSTGCTNSPFGNNYCYCLVLGNGGTGICMQICMQMGLTNTGMYARKCTDGVWSNWEIVCYDTGWVNCTTSQGTWEYCQVRKIGKVVHLRGRASALGRPSGAIFTIPSGYRPSKQESAYGEAGWVSAPTISRWYINTDGTCGMDWNLSLVNGTDITENTWKKIEATWFID